MPNRKPARAPASPQVMPSAKPDWPVEMRLPDGRRVRATFQPPIARRRDLENLGRMSAANARQAREASQRQRAELKQMKRSYAELERRVEILQSQANQAAITLASTFAAFESRLQGVQTQHQAAIANNRSLQSLAVQQRKDLKGLATSAQLQQVTSVVHTTQAAAYGSKGSLLATDNLLLAGNQLFWTMLDPMLRGLGFTSGTAPSIATWLAPFGALVTGQVVVGTRQHERFISDIATFNGASDTIVVSLRRRVASGFFEKLRRRTDVPVTVVPIDTIDAFVTAFVRQGEVHIEVESLNGAVRGRVGWMVDLGADLG